MFDIVHRIAIKGSPQAVFSALTTRDGLAGWWTRDTTAEPRVGATNQFRFGDGGPDMEVTELDPERRVRWACRKGPKEWIGTDLSFTLSRDGDWTIINFAHRGWNEQVEFMGQ